MRDRTHRRARSPPSSTTTKKPSLRSQLRYAHPAQQRRNRDQSSVLTSCERRQQSEYLASACETGEVVLHKAGQTELDGFLTRFYLPARSVSFDPRGKRAVVTSDEVIAKVIDVKEPTKIQLLTGHSRSIREASWSPDGHFVVR